MAMTINDSIKRLESLDVKTYTNNSIHLIAPMLGAVISFIIGTICFLLFETNILGGIIGGISGIVAWFGFYISKNMFFVKAQSVIITEINGKYHRTLEAGWHLLCLCGFIEIVVSDNINLNKDEGHIKTENDSHIDFACGSSAPIQGDMYFEIVDPILWQYRTSNPLQWMRSQVATFLQPILERRTLDEARTQKPKINELFTEEKDDNFDEDITISNTDYGNDGCDNADEKRLVFKKFIKSQIGVEITAILIRDIDIPNDLKEIRQKELVARLENRIAHLSREARSEESMSYIDAIHASVKYAAEIGLDYSKEDVERIWNSNKNREAYEKSGANVTIVGDNIGNMLGSLFTKNSR